MWLSHLMSLFLVMSHTIGYSPTGEFRLLFITEAREPQQLDSSMDAPLSLCHFLATKSFGVSCNFRFIAVDVLGVFAPAPGIAPRY
jgi:hypothetical protein